MSSNIYQEDKRLLNIHANRIIKRDIDQLLGICEFALQDGHIDQSEAESILCWLNNHEMCLDTWPANILFDRLSRVLQDDFLDSDEEKEILSLVMSISSPRDQSGLVVPSSLPLDKPAPVIVFNKRTFCFTGVFEFGRRADCQIAIEARGGIFSPSVNKKLNYLIVGNVGSEMWRHTSFGAKIAKAVECRESGLPLSIVSEQDWVAQLQI